MPLFAQAVDNMAARPLGTGTKMVLGDIVWVLLAALGLALILFPLARYWRRRSKRREHRSRPAIVQNSIRSTGDSATRGSSDDDSEEGDDSEDTEGDADSSSGKHRKRRRRRGHRPRNPTLEETGGLPPSRANDSSSQRG